MTSEGYVKFEYFSKSVPPYYNHSSFPELLDDEKITIETPCLEMNYHQYAGMFKKFLMAVGFDEKNVMQAGCSLAFNEGYSEKLMQEVAEEYDLIMVEDFPKKIEERMNHEKSYYEKQLQNEKQRATIWEERYHAIYRKLKEIVPEVNYTEEEVDSMCKENAISELNEDMNSISDFLSNKKTLKTWNGLVPGSNLAVEKGCKCPILDNDEMPDDKKWISLDCPIHGN
jgi:hypothetical protein